MSIANRTVFVREMRWSLRANTNDPRARADQTASHWRRSIARTVRRAQSAAVGYRARSIGLTGNTTGPHLHLEIYASGMPVDPLSVLPPMA